MPATPARSGKVAIVTNNVECERHLQYYARLEKYFRANGWGISPDFDVERVVICACGFHDFMYRKVENTLRHLRTLGIGDDRVIIMGCLPKTHEDALADRFHGSVIPYGGEDALDSLAARGVPFSAVEPPHHQRRGEAGPRPPRESMYYIKVAQGCLRQCTFCVINRAKGALKSEPPAKIVEQYRRALAQGFRRIFLMGEDTFAYGADTGTNIIDLSAELLAHDSRVELHFGSLNGRWLVTHADGIRELCRSGVVKQLHVGLQHVNDPVLARMGRFVPFAAIREVLAALKGETPSLVLSGDVLVGFPGETEEAFQELLEYVRDDSAFDYISHFGYSDVRGAPANGFDGKVDPLVISSRWDLLRTVLGRRSFYNRVADARDGYREAYQATFDRDYSFCRDTFFEE